MCRAGYGRVPEGGLASGTMTRPDPNPDAFAPGYAAARQAWLAAVQACDGRLDGLRHPQQGPEREGLWQDVATFGDAQAADVFVVACGTHGIEGHAGSAVMTAWLRGGGPGALPAGKGVVLVHAINPWGMAHWQRGTERNVDLNRNFIDFGRAPPANPGYAELHPHLMLADWSEPAIARAFAAMDALRARAGEQAFSDAFNGGQYRHADGLFYGGDRAEWANVALRQQLRKHLAGARRCVLVDLHTGIGPYGQPFMINFAPPGSFGRERATAIWGAAALSGAGSTHKALAAFQGVLFDAFAAELPGCALSATAVEFGTLERHRMQRAHLANAWMRRQQGDSETLRRARAEYREAFVPSDPAWRADVVRHGVELLRRGRDALVESGPPA